MSERTKELASVDQDLMNDCISKAYNSLPDKDKHIIDGMMAELEEHAKDKNHNGFGVKSRRELLAKLGCWLNDNDKAVKHA